uniref:Coiled-coil domain containing 142 n=1 Tax=Cyanoderma ruficeps TaxID=181631 RepID=A0A8C3R9L5_9PASS
MLRSVTPGLRRLLSPRSSRRSDGNEDDDEDDDEAASIVVPLEQSFPGLRRRLCVWEDPRTETFVGYVQPHPGGAGDFSEDAVRQRVAERGAALHALLQHRHQLRLARDFTRRLKASSDFLQRLLALPGPGEPGDPGDPAPALRELCLELRAHAGHWAALLRRLRTDAWLRALPQRRGEAVAHMRWALLLPALTATRLAGRHIEGRLRELGRPSTPSPASECLADLFQGLEIYNRVVQGLAEELGPEVKAPSAFTVGGVLQLLAAERGRAMAQRLQPLLWPQNGNVRDGHVRWEDVVVPWPAEHDTAEKGMGADTEPSRAEVPPALAAELQALCQEDEELMGHVFGALVASADSLWQPVLSESPEPLGLAPGLRPGSAGGWKAVRWLDAARGPVAAALSARYRLLLWEAAGAVLGDSPGTPPATPSATVTAAWELSRALAVGTWGYRGCGGSLRVSLPRPDPRCVPTARVPPECQEELRGLCLRLLCRSILCSWDTGTGGWGSTGWGTGGTECGAGCGLWDTSETFPKPEEIHRDTLPEPLPSPGSTWELQLCQQIRDVANSIQVWMANSIPHCRRGILSTRMPVSPGVTLCHPVFPVSQLFSGDVLWMFSTSCKRLSAEIFDQTMPLGRHWRLRPRAELPSSPSAYAAAAVQAVLGQVLQGAQALPHDAQVPTLARVTTAFLEAWMDHILTRRIKFSLQGALQLRRDFEAVRELVCSESSGLAPEARQALQALCVFRHTDTAVRCLLQQPGGLGGPPRGWGSLRRCCAHPLEPSMDPLPGLDPLEGLGPTPGTPPLAPEADLPSRPESPFPGSQQQWLSLRLHRARRWRVPGLPCVGNSPEG